MNTVVPVNRVYSRCKSQVFIENRNREQEACSIGKMAFKRTVQVAGAPECHYRQVHCKLPLQVSKVLGPFATAALERKVRIQILNITIHGDRAFFSICHPRQS